MMQVNEAGNKAKTWTPSEYEQKFLCLVGLINDLTYYHTQTSGQLSSIPLPQRQDYFLIL